MFLWIIAYLPYNENEKKGFSKPYEIEKKMNSFKNNKSGKLVKKKPFSNVFFTSLEVFLPLTKPQKLFDF